MKPEFIEAVPQYWKYRLVLAAVPKDGTPFEDSFSVELERPLYYWAQVYTFASPLGVKVEACRAEGSLLISVSVDSEAQVPCSRCLEPAGVAIAGELRYLFSLRTEEYKCDEKDGKPDGEEELILLDTWEDEIDLAPLIWEVIITSLPAAALCSEACRGLCPQCGTNLNKSSCSCRSEKGDPRFDVLRSLEDKQNN